MAQIISKKHVPPGERRGPSGGKPPVMALTKSKAKTAAPTLSLPLGKSPAPSHSGSPWAHTHAGGVPDGGVSPASASVSEGGLLLVPLSDRGRAGGGNDEHQHQHQQLLGAWEQRFGEEIVQALKSVVKAKRYLVSDLERQTLPYWSIGQVADNIGEIDLEEVYGGAEHICSSLAVKSFDSTYDLPQGLSSSAPPPSSSLSPFSWGLGLERLAATEISCVTFDTNKEVNDHNSGNTNNVTYTYGQVTTPSPSLPSWTNASASGGSLSASAARNAPAPPPPPPPPSAATASPSSYHHHHGVFPAVFASPPLTSVAGPTAQFPSSAPTQTTRHEERILLPAPSAGGLLASPASQDKKRMIVPTPQNVVLSTMRGAGDAVAFQTPLVHVPPRGNNRINTSVFIFQKMILTSRRLRPILSEVFESLLMEKSKVNSREGGGEGMMMGGGAQYLSSSRASSSLSARSTAKASSSVTSPHSSASHSIARMQAAGGVDHQPNTVGSYPQSEGGGLTPHTSTSKNQSPSRAALYAHHDRSEIIGGDHTSCRVGGAGKPYFTNSGETKNTKLARASSALHEEGGASGSFALNAHAPADSYRFSERRSNGSVDEAEDFKTAVRLIERFHEEGAVGCIEDELLIDPSCWYQPHEGEEHEEGSTRCSFVNIGGVWLPLAALPRLAAEGYIAIIRHAFAVSVEPPEGVTSVSDQAHSHSSARVWRPVRTPKRTAAVHNKGNGGIAGDEGGHWRVCDEIGGEEPNRVAELAIVRVPIENKGSCSDERTKNEETFFPLVATGFFPTVALDLSPCEGSSMGPIPCLHSKLQKMSSPNSEEESRSTVVALADELWSLYNSFALSELDEASLEYFTQSLLNEEGEEEEGEGEKNHHQQLQQHEAAKMKLIPVSNSTLPPLTPHHLASCGLEGERKGQTQRSADLHNVGGDTHTVPSSFPVVGPPPQPNAEGYAPPLARHSHAGTCLSPLDDDQVGQGLSTNMERIQSDREAVIKEAVRRYRIPNPPACGAIFLPDGSVLGWGRSTWLPNEKESESEDVHHSPNIKKGDEDHVSVRNGLVTGAGRTVVDGALPAVTTTTSSSGSTNNGDGRYRAGAGAGVGDFAFESDEDMDRGYGNDGGSSTTPTTALYLRTSTMSPLSTPTLVREPPPASAFERTEDDYYTNAVSRPPTRLLMPTAQIDLRGRTTTTTESETSEPLTLLAMGDHNTNKTAKNKEKDEGGPLSSAEITQSNAHTKQGGTFGNNNAQPSASSDCSPKPSNTHGHNVARVEVRPNGHLQGTQNNSTNSGPSGAFEYLFASSSALSPTNSGSATQPDSPSPCGAPATVSRQRSPPLPTILGSKVGGGGLFPFEVLDAVELCPREHNNTISRLGDSESHTSRSLLYSNGMICAKTFFVLTSNSSSSSSSSSSGYDGGPSATSFCDKNERPSIAACPYLSRNCHHHQASHQHRVYSKSKKGMGQEEEGNRKGRGDTHHNQNRKREKKSKRRALLQKQEDSFLYGTHHQIMDLFPLLHHFPSLVGGALPMFFQTLASTSIPQTMPAASVTLSGRKGEDREVGTSIWPGISAATALVEHITTIVVPLMSEMTTLMIVPFLVPSPTIGSNLYLVGQYEGQQQGSRGGGGKRESIYFWLGVAVCNVCLPLVAALRMLHIPLNEKVQNDLVATPAVLSVGSFYALIRNYFSKPYYIAALTTVWRVYSGASVGSSGSVSATSMIDSYSRRSREAMVLLAHFRAALGHKDWIVQRSFSASFGKNRHLSHLGLVHELGSGHVPYTKEGRAAEQPSRSLASSLFCVICCLPCIQGSSVMICRVCGHGGHAEHIMAWRGVRVEGTGKDVHGSQSKRNHSICATGCGCDCVY